jgi:hypothetical protein
MASMPMRGVGVADAKVRCAPDKEGEEAGDAAK